MNPMIRVGMEYLGAGADVHRQLVDYYNWHCVPLVDPARRYDMKLTDNWCAMFLSVLAHKAGLSRGDFPYEVSVYYQVEAAKDRGQYSKNIDSIRVGDLVVYDWTGRGTFNHVGIVSNVSNSSLDVLEGNYNRTVGVRTVRRTSKAINGFIALNSGVVPTDKSRLEALVMATMRGEFGNGMERKVSLGSDYGEVQRIINTLI